MLLLIWNWEIPEAPQIAKEGKEGTLLTSSSENNDRWGLTSTHRRFC